MNTLSLTAGGDSKSLDCRIPRCRLAGFPGPSHHLTSARSNDLYRITINTISLAKPLNFSLVLNSHDFKRNDGPTTKE